jgi:hypothetical protein
VGFFLTKIYLRKYCMITYSHLIQQAHFTIVNQDWEKMRNVFNSVYEKRNAVNVNKVYQTEYQSIRYDFKNYGEMTADSKFSDRITFSGGLLESSLPVIQQIRSFFKDINLYSINLAVLNGKLDTHIDFKTIETSNRCHLVYVIHSEDPNAVTTVYNDWDSDIKESFPSNEGSAWLLDPTKPHEVINSGRRETLQFVFHDNFQNVAEFLIKSDPIEFDGSK